MKIHNILIFLWLFNFINLFGDNSNEENMILDMRKEFTRFKQAYNSAEIIVKCKRSYGKKAIKYKIDRIYKGEKKQIEEISKDGFVRFMQIKRFPNDKTKYRSEYIYMFIGYSKKDKQFNLIIAYDAGITNNRFEIGGLSIDMSLLSKPEKINERLKRIFEILSEWEEEITKKTKDRNPS